MTTASVFALILLAGTVAFIGVLLILLIALFAGRKKHQAATSTKSEQRPQVVPAQSSSRVPVSGRRLPYQKRKQLLTNAERTFADALQTATPNTLVVYPQMRLASIVDVAAWGKHNEKNFYRIQAKCVDFVLCHAHTSEPKLVIELDDASHDRADRKARDAFVDDVLASAGIPILHVRWQRIYDGAELHNLIHEKLHLPAMQPPATSKTTVPSYTAAESGWMKPTAVGATPAVQSTKYAASPPIVVREMRIVCAQCQQDVRRDAKFCNGCGAILAP